MINSEFDSFKADLLKQIAVIGDKSKKQVDELTAEHNANLALAARKEKEVEDMIQAMRDDMAKFETVSGCSQQINGQLGPATSRIQSQIAHLEQDIKGISLQMVVPGICDPNDEES